MFEDDLATFYWNLYEKLKDKGFDEDQSMKIILREAKIPRATKGEKEFDMQELLKNLEKKVKK